MAIKKGLKMDAFVNSVRPDPNSSEKLQLLQGFLGKSNVDGHVRIYFDEALNNFVEIPENDIIHALPCDKSENPLGGCRVWVKKSTVVTFGNPQMGNRPKSSFMEGDIMSAYRNAGMAGLTPFPDGPIGGPGNPNPFPNPQSLVDGCPSRMIDCGVPNVPNGPKPPIGPSLIDGCPSINQICITRNLQNCLTENWPPKTFFQATCFRTCQQVSCFRTCFQPTCFQTCQQPSCFRTCFQPTCLGPLCGQKLPTINDPGCNDAQYITGFNGPSPVINTGGGLVNRGGFTGNFNPYFS
ncbi:MAG: hypothetical protein AAF960_15495 [Bacteroidota bacterium]